MAKETGQAVEPTETQRQELERRLRAHEEDPETYESWEELRRRLREATR